MIQKLTATLFCSVFLVSFLNAQELDRVFVIGENEKGYETLSQTYKKTLLDACNSDMVVAFEKWILMMQDMEEYANRINYDIRGVKLWFHVFFNADGTVQNIGYQLRNESRNINPEEFRGFLISFMNRFKLSVNFEEGFSHYSIASFPVYSESLNH